MALKVLGLVAASLMLIVGVLWTGQANGWIGDAEPSRGFASLGGICAGLGVALFYVIFQSSRRK